ncbi:DNA cross-link repair protein PSO2/SNM1 [Clarireedia jacksonii]
MFRNPRENNTRSTESPLRPSTGRPPTPPHDFANHRQSSMTMPSRNTNKPPTPRSFSKTNTTVSNKQPPKKAVAATRTPAKPNKSILTFFKKVDSPFKDDSIFISHGAGQSPQLPRRPTPDLPEADDLYGISDSLVDGRYNENGGAIKKRKLSGNLEDENHEAMIDDEDPNQSGSSHTVSLPTELCTPAPPGSPSTKDVALKSEKRRKTGPFLDDSDSEDDMTNAMAQMKAVEVEKTELDVQVNNQLNNMNEVVETMPIKQENITENQPVVPTVRSVLPPEDPAWKPRKRVPVAKAQAKWEALQSKTKRSSEESSGSSVDNPPGKAEGSKYFDKETAEVRKVPNLKKESTSIDEWADFENMGEFLDEDGNGEEFMERKWMEKQASLEAEGEFMDDEESFNGFDDDEEPSNDSSKNASVSNCPICDGDLDGVNPDEASKHVNSCLDGNPIPLPSKAKLKSKEVKMMPQDAKNRFARKAAVPRPGQSNPIDLGNSSGNAYSKIMSGHAEDAAWASAADAEKSSRGKPAYQRTCPFYKIMPGFFICVDAFRYGAVQDCNAYFLSHFHSDHYIGLTSTWAHGPIYCSKVTGNLVKQQLKVDPKWVVSIDFDEKIEVPNTQGASVTMIPANHCPGSSLFLFERAMGRGQNPKIQRILHCGDFRACPAHIAHPRLMPDLVDSITGKTKQQKIDVCYLDTTYLNPRYAFPPQEDVIKACADMCVSLRKEKAEESDAWETAKRERAGSGMTKFIAAGSKNEDNDETNKDKKKSRGRLLVVCGTYSIGKERICLGIARALDCKIYAPPGKMRICAALEDPELMSRMTSDPREAQIHMQMIMEIRAETLQEYLNSYKPHFTRIVGFRPSGWNYKPPVSRLTDSPPLHTILHAANWRSRYDMGELVPQRGSTKEAQCFGVPYSEHSSFRELTLFVMGLRIEKVVPTVNVGSEVGRKKMKVWIDRWLGERRKHGVLKFADGDEDRKGRGDELVRW